LSDFGQFNQTGNDNGLPSPTSATGNQSVPSNPPPLAEVTEASAVTANLIQSTEPDTRLQQIKSGRNDPFSAPALQFSVEQVIPPPEQVSLQGEQNTVEPLPPEPSLAEEVQIKGMIQIGAQTSIFVKAPGERFTRYVSTGQHLSDGRVLVKHIEPASGLGPIVVLEEDGIEVVRSITETLPTSSSQATLQKSSDQLLREAFENRRNSFQVEGQGTVISILQDDLEGSRHQRFIIRLDSGQTLLVAHNIDLAPRINSLQVGDSVMFYGEYEYKPEGGVIHWTHHDPDGSHVGGWLKHNGRTYQ